MSKILDELKCEHCGKKLSHKQELYETAWSSLYWCGSVECAYQIMENECMGDQLDPDDPTNRE